LLQVRPITGLQDRESAPNWDRGVPAGRWARVSLVESVVGPTSPLFQSFALPGITEGYHRAARDIGLDHALPSELFIVVNGHLYYRVSFPRQTRRIVGRWLLLRGKWLATSVYDRYELARRRYGIRVREVRQSTYGSGLTIKQRLGHIMELWVALGEYYVSIQSGILPAAYVSERLFSVLYEHLVPRRHRFPIGNFFTGLPTQSWMSEMEFDRLLLESERAGVNLEDVVCSYVSQGASGSAGGNHVGQVIARLRNYVNRFGHISYSLDPAHELPSSSADMMLLRMRRLRSRTRVAARERWERNRSVRAVAVASLVARHA
jgi:pyruvate,water dikinase